MEIDLKGKGERFLSGNPLGTLLSFAVPIVCGNVFQQLYNIVDAIVVGRFLGDEALTGISVAAPILDILNAVIIGGSIGIGVLVGQLCGAKDWKRLRQVHASALIGGIAVAVLLSVGGVLFAGRILRWQGVTADVCVQALRYLHMIFAGLVFCYIYNYYAAVLRAYGDSKTPFVVLLISSVFHALLDLLLVGILHWGIGAVALSTTLSQLFSGACLVFYSRRHYPQLSLTRAEMVFQPRIGMEILRFAWAAALQQAVVCLGRFFIQGMLSELGGHVVSGYNMGMRAEQFLYCFSQGIGASMVVGISQCAGAGDWKRVRRFYLLGIGCETILGLVAGTLCQLIPAVIIGVFSTTPEVIAAGSAYIGTIGVWYIAAFYGEVIQSMFRGIGRLRFTMLWSTIQIAIRVVAASFLIPRYGVSGIALSAVAAWIVLVTVEGGCSLIAAGRMKRTQADAA